MMLRFIVSRHDIESNTEMITTITWMGPIQNVKGYNGSWDASRLSAASYHASASEVSPFTEF
jgi:hypothetical protein